MSKPLFRIEEPDRSPIKGSPNDPVYLRVGSSTYGIKAIDNGSIRVTSGKDTEDATQVKTLRQYASGTPKGEDTGIAWRIVGVGGGTAIRSVSADGKIVVRTLANEGKEDGCRVGLHTPARDPCSSFGGGSDDALGGFTAKAGFDRVLRHPRRLRSRQSQLPAPEHRGSCRGILPRLRCLSLRSTQRIRYPLGIRPRHLEAPRGGRPRGRGRRNPPTSRSTVRAVSAKIREIMNEFDRTGMVGRSKHTDRKSNFVKQAVAVAYSMTNQSYRKSGKRLPKGVKRAEGEHSHPFDAPMGYGQEPQPFYGNPRRLARDRWGNLRFIRRRKDGTYMDNVDFGRSIQTDRRMRAKTWAPTGFRNGDGSWIWLTSLMGAEDDDLSDYYRFVVDIYDTDGNECYGAGGWLPGKGSTIQQAADDARKAIIEDMEQEQRRINKAQSRNTAPRATARRQVAGARFVSASQFDDGGVDSSRSAPIYPPTSSSTWRWAGGRLRPRG